MIKYFFCDTLFYNLWELQYGNNWHYIKVKAAGGLYIHMEKIRQNHLYISRQNIPFFLYVYFLILLYCNGTFFIIAHPFVPYINLIFSLYIICKIRKMKESRTVLLLLAGLYVISVSMVNGSSFGAASAFLAVFTYVLYFENIYVNDSFMKILLFGGLCMLMWYLPKSNVVYDNFIDGKAMYSPNSISMVLVVIFIWFNTYFHIKKEKSCIWVISLYLCVMAMIFLMKTRSAMAVLLLYGLLFWIVPRKLYNRKKLVIFATLIIIIFGCIFPLIYVSLSSNSQMAEFIYKLTGKYLFTGRDLIWKRFFAAIRENKLGFFIGLGSNAEYSIGQGLSLHNSYLNIILNYGIGGIVILIGFLCLKIKDLYRKSNDRLSTGQISLLAGYFCLLAESCAEVTLLTSYMVLFTNMLFGLSLNYYFYKNSVSEGQVQYADNHYTNI